VVVTFIADVIFSYLKNSVIINSGEKSNRVISKNFIGFSALTVFAFDVTKVSHGKPMLKFYHTKRRE
jgi:hypothetical protein